MRNSNISEIIVRLHQCLHLCLLCLQVHIHNTEMGEKYPPNCISFAVQTVVIPNTGGTQNDKYTVQASDFVVYNSYTLGLHHEWMHGGM